MNAEKTSRRDALLVLFVLLLSGNPSLFAVAGGMDVVLLAGGVVLGLLVLTHNVRVFDRRAVTAFAGFLGILVIQAFQFSFFPVVTILGFAVRLFFGAALVALVDDLPRAYVRAMIWVSVYVLAFYVVDQLCLALNIPFRDLFEPLERFVGLDADHRFSLIYTFTVYDGTYRNAGFFREPGLFAGYVLLALLFLVVRFKSYERKQAIKYLLILLVALLSSFSTAGYVTAPLVLAAAAFQYQKQTVSKRPEPTKSRTGLFVVVLGTSVLALWLVSENSEFLQQKVIEQYEGYLEEDRNFEITRFGAALLDFQAIEVRPVFGWGIHESTKYALTPEFLDLELSPSGGVTGWMRSFGLVGLALFVWLVWLGATGLVGRRGFAAVYVTGVILVIMQPNAFLNYPMFMALLFLPPLPQPVAVQAGGDPVADAGR